MLCLLHLRFKPRAVHIAVWGEVPLDTIVHDLFAIDQGTQGHHTNNVKAVKDPQDLIQVYRRSVQLARKAGFDGVELLCQG